MAISSRLKDYLDQAKVRYTVAKHSVVYTAQEIAAAQHVPGRQLAKSVLLLTAEGPILAVLPAVYLVDLANLKRLLKTSKLSIGREADIKQHFPDVEVGAMSPFGNLYGVPVVVEETLSAVQEIVFNGGTHAETITMGYGDFAKLVKPTVGSFGRPIAGPAKRKRPAKGKRPAKRKRAAAKKSSKSKRPARRRATTRTTRPRRSPR